MKTWSDLNSLTGLKLRRKARLRSLALYYSTGKARIKMNERTECTAKLTNCARLSKTNSFVIRANIQLFASVYMLL